MSTDLTQAPDVVDQDQAASRAPAQLFDQKATRARLGGIGLTKLYELWQSGELGSVYVGKLRFSSEAQLTDYIQRLESAS